ncbi:MAG: RNA methyltransferase [Hydrogenophilus thermoluteolus]
MRDRVDFVLVRPQHPGNIGAAARALKTMGFSRLVLVAPLADPCDPTAIARASGATDLLAQARVVDTLDAALADTVFAAAFTARSREYVVDFRTPETLSQEVRALLEDNPAVRVALVFGNEAHGLRNDEVWRCSVPVAIPANPEYSSLNLAAAVQIAAYVLAQRLSDADGARSLPVAVVPDPDTVPCTLAEIEGVVDHFLEVAAAIDFYDPKTPKRLEARLRRWLQRSRLERAEANILRGFLKACARRLNENQTV